MLVNIDYEIIHSKEVEKMFVIIMILGMRCFEHFLIHLWHILVQSLTVSFYHLDLLFEFDKVIVYEHCTIPKLLCITNITICGNLIQSIALRWTKFWNWVIKLFRLLKVKKFFLKKLFWWSYKVSYLQSLNTNDLLCNSFYISV